MLFPLDSKWQYSVWKKQLGHSNNVNSFRCNNKHSVRYAYKFSVTFYKQFYINVRFLSYIMFVPYTSRIVTCTYDGPIYSLSIFYLNH